MEPSNLLWTATGALFALAVFAAVAEHRRQRRRDIDRPGFVPWNTVQVLAFMLAFITAALALKAG
jgi:hypothetical protein